MTYSSWLAATARQEFTIRAGLAAVAQFEDEHGASTPGEGRRRRPVGRPGRGASQSHRDWQPAAQRLMGVTYDTGALVAADRGGRRQWAWRGGNRQALLSRLLTGCHVEALDDTRARAIGALAARAAVTDIVDTCVVEGALRRRDLIIGSDPGDLHAIAAATSGHLEIDHP